jgi:virulence-associated protein VapD
VDTPAIDPKVIKLTYNLSGIGLSEQDIAELLNKHGVPKTEQGSCNLDDRLSDIYLSAYKLKLSKVINDFEESIEHIHTLLDDKHYEEFRENTDGVLSDILKIIK